MNNLQKEPFNHIVIDNFYDDIDSLIESCSKIKLEESNCDLYQFLRTDGLLFSNEKAIKKFIDKLNEFTPQVQKLFNKNLNSVTLDYFEYHKTHYLLCHDDDVTNRKVAFVFYLNDLAANDGGALALFDSNWKKSKHISPKKNRLILFEVEIGKSFHEVEEVTGNIIRKSVTGWFIE